MRERGRGGRGEGSWREMIGREGSGRGEGSGVKERGE